jgi:hypothetical protein
MRAFACTYCGFESPRVHGCFSVESVVCFAGRGLCDELITYPEQSYRLWCLVVCDLENLVNEEVMSIDGLLLHKNKMSDSSK